MITVPPISRRSSSLRSAAGFIATSTVGASPGVVTVSLATCTWKAETPCRVPAGALISAGKSGRVAKSLPNRALALVKRSPVSCMPSPESPAKRMTSRSRSSTVRCTGGWVAVSVTCVPSVLRSLSAGIYGRVTALGDRPEVQSSTTPTDREPLRGRVR